MKKYILIIPFVLFSVFLNGQFSRGKVVVRWINSTALKNNPAGENPKRHVSIYLPAEYDHTLTNYPVIYFLHFFPANDSEFIAWTNFNRLLDSAIYIGKIRPVIVVIADNCTLFRGSLFTNSSFTGNWADYNAKDVVEFADKNFRTIASKEGRGIAGHSQGGSGAIKLGMLFPNVFSSVYALSPSVLGLTKELGPDGIGFKRIQYFKTREQLISGYDDIFPNAMVAIGRAFSPNPGKPPFFADLPYIYRGDTLEIRYDVLDKWQKNTPIAMIDSLRNNLKALRALKLDWGRNDVIEHVPITCREFSQKLENLGIDHFAEEYFGTHDNKVFTPDGRVINLMLPFFNDYLKFEIKR
jgi:S-formylglutathione hydrolase FrmB